METIYQIIYFLIGLWLFLMFVGPCLYYTKTLIIRLYNDHFDPPTPPFWFPILYPSLVFGPPVAIIFGVWFLTRHGPSQAASAAQLFIITYGLGVWVFVGIFGALLFQVYIRLPPNPPLWRTPIAPQICDFLQSSQYGLYFDAGAEQYLTQYQAPALVVEDILRPRLVDPTAKIENGRPVSVNGCGKVTFRGRDIEFENLRRNLFMSELLVFMHSTNRRGIDIDQYNPKNSLLFAVDTALIAEIFGVKHNFRQLRSNPDYETNLQGMRSNIINQYGTLPEFAYSHHGSAVAAHAPVPVWERPIYSTVLDQLQEMSEHFKQNNL